MRAGLILVGGLFAACGTPGPIPLAERGCVEAWWLGTESKCSVECPTQPECSLSDCVGVGVLGLRPNGDSVFAYISLSKAARQFSAFGGATKDRWTLEKAGDLVIHSGEEPIKTRCQGSRLDLGLATYTKATPEQQRAFDASAESSNWTNVKY